MLRPLPLRDLDEGRLRMRLLNQWRPVVSPVGPMLSTLPHQWLGTIFLRRRSRMRSISRISLGEQVDTRAHLSSSSGSDQDNQRVDPPFLPPVEVQIHMPDFSHCKPHECGQHHCRDKGTIQCRNCNSNTELGISHKLPCGHSLCLDCLQATAVNAHQCLYDKPTRDGILLLLSILHRRLRAMPSLQNEEARDSTRNGLEDLKIRIQRRLGLTCCNQLMDLSKHIPCLGEEQARRLLIVQWFVNVAPELSDYRCGWPDCGEFIPAFSYWVNKDGHERWRCIVCGGNSMMQSNHQWNKLQPAR